MDEGRGRMSDDRGQWEGWNREDGEVLEEPFFTAETLRTQRKEIFIFLLRGQKEKNYVLKIILY